MGLFAPAVPVLVSLVVVLTVLWRRARRAALKVNAHSHTAKKKSLDCRIDATENDE